LTSALLVLAVPEVITGALSELTMPLKLYVSALLKLATPS
jgi:hypothetical protein